VHHRESSPAVHGGYAATLLDSVLDCAVHTTLDAGVGYSTAGPEVKFMRPMILR
jgi:acyl-coenzyme A thioesterase PaaI-like protein